MSSKTLLNILQSGFSLPLFLETMLVRITTDLCVTKAKLKGQILLDLSADHSLFLDTFSPFTFQDTTLPWFSCYISEFFSQSAFFVLPLPPLPLNMKWLRIWFFVLFPILSRVIPWVIP